MCHNMLLDGKSANLSVNTGRSVLWQAHILTTSVQDAFGILPSQTGSLLVAPTLLQQTVRMAATLCMPLSVPFCDLA